MPFGEQALPVRSDDEAEVEDDKPVAGLGQILDRESHARIGNVENGSDAALVIPLAGDLETDVDLVLVIGDKELDRLAEDGAAEILDRHPRHLNRPRPREVRVGTGLIVHDPDREGVGGARQLNRGAKRQEKTEGESPPKHAKAPFEAVRMSLAELQREGKCAKSGQGVDLAGAGR